jgi:serine/threonine-protein kinase
MLWHLPSSITPDGTRIIGYGQSKPGADLDISTIPMTSPSKDETLFHTPFNERFPEISPNGRYIAYLSEESNWARDVYVRPYPHVDRGVWKVSREGGTRAAVWARNGRELFYLDGSKTLMAVPVDTTGPTFSASTPAKVFEAAKYSNWYPQRNYDVSPNGQRFLMIKDGPVPAQLIVVQHWFEELKAHVPPGS